MVNKKAVIICTIIAILTVGVVVYKNILKVNEMYSTNEISVNTTIKKEENKTANIDNNAIHEIKESNVIGQEEKESQENENKENSNLSEENTTKEDNNGEISKQEGKNKAIDMARKKWGEDDTVYYFIDRVNGNIYNVSVRSKDTTESLVEYEIDVKNNTIK